MLDSPEPHAVAASGSRLSIQSVVFPLVVALLCAAPAMAQVVFDAASNASPATVSTAAAITVLWNHTTGLAKKEYLVVGVSMKLSGGGATVGGVVYGNEAGGPASNMVLLGAATNGTNERAELWGLAGPAPGTHQTAVTITNRGGGPNVGVVASAHAFLNVLQ